MKRLFSWVLGCSLCLQGIIHAQEAALQSQGEADSNAEVAAEQLQPPKAYTEKLHQMQWVQVDAEGQFSGSVVSLFRGGTSEKIPNAQVALIRSGQVKSSTTTDEKGDFSFSGVLPGSYTIEGLGKGGTFSYSLHVLPGQADQGSYTKIYAIVPGGSVVTKYFARYAMPNSPVDSIMAGSSEQRFSQYNGQVRADEMGALRGSLLLPGVAFASKDMSATEVIILQNGREVTTTMANADGTFSIGGLEPGVYGLVVAGPVGRGAVAFELIENKPVVQAAAGKAGRFVTAQEGAADVLNIELAPPASPAEDELAMEDLGMPVPGGGLAGPGGSGAGAGAGGGAGGVGGAGGLLGLAAAAGAIVALTSDDDNNVASPIVNP